MGIMQEEILVHVEDFSAEQFDRQRTDVERAEQGERVTELIQQNQQLHDEVGCLCC